MNQRAKAAVLTGLGLAVNAAAVAGEQPATFGTEPRILQHGDVLQVNTNEFESSFLNVIATCKSSHAAFDAVSVGLEDVALEVRLIHAEIESA